MIREPMSILVDVDRSVSALLLAPAEPRACFVFAHGAGAGMRHPFMEAMADGLAVRGIATLRFQFPFMERGSRRVDPPPVAHAGVRAAVAAATTRFGALPVVAGGKSFGGRMTSQAESQAPLPGVRGLVFFGFPLHPAGRPGVDRAEHLQGVTRPMLFLQGDRDELADATLIAGVCAGLYPRATLAVFADADHAFHVRASTGRTDAETRGALLDAFVRWVEPLLG